MGFKARASKSANKTQPITLRPAAFIANLADPRRRQECTAVMAMMREVSGEEPTMWGTSIVGFGTYHYKYPSGREGHFLRTGFSPRKRTLRLCCIPGYGKQGDLLAKLGPHKTSVSCLHIRKLSDIDFSLLRQIVERSLRQMVEIHGA